MAKVWPLTKFDSNRAVEHCRDIIPKFTFQDLGELKTDVDIDF